MVWGLEFRNRIVVVFMRSRPSEAGAWLNRLVSKDKAFRIDVAK